MTTSLLAAPPDVRLPRVSQVPDRISSAAVEAVELAESAGLHLDPWQQWCLDGALGEREDGKWSAFECALIIPRQNGKGAILEARELAGLFLFGERLILHSAHEFKTAQEAFRRILTLVESTPDLSKQVGRVRTSHGEEGIELKDGRRLRFVARSTGSGRGFTGDVVILDEAYNLPVQAMGALLPTMSARPNPQLWYASSAGRESSEVLAGVRDRGIAGANRLFYAEWSAGSSDDHEADHVDLDDREAWRQANPAMDIRIEEEFVERERAALDEEEFARERLGIWAGGKRKSVIDPDVWRELADPSSKPTGIVTFAVDVPPERNSASIAVAGVREDGRWHVEVIDRQTGTGWAVDRVVELVEKWKPTGVLLDPGSPAGSLIPGLAKAGVEPVLITGREMAQAAGGFYDAVQAGTLRHIGQPALNVAVDAGRKRTVGDAWAWHRRDTSTDIAPLVAVTLALHGANKPSGEKKRDRSGRAAFY